MTRFTALRENARVRANARSMREQGQRARETARRMRETARRAADRMRDVIITLQPARLRQISGGSDERSGGIRESIWISVAEADGAVCSECGIVIVVGETMYDVALDGREMRLGSRCGRSHIEQVRAILTPGRRPKAS